MDDHSDEEDFQPQRQDDIFGNIDFDDEAGIDSEDEVASFSSPSSIPVSQLPPAGDREDPSLQTPRNRVSSWRLEGSPRADDRRIELSVQKTPTLFNTEKPLLELDDDDDDGNALVEPPETKKPTKKRKPGLRSTNELLTKVSSLLNRMEAAAANDLESNAQQKPAIEKLKMLEEVEEACIQRDMQQMLMTDGLLGVLKSWIEPLPDATLPNIRIRESVLKILLKLPIDTADARDRNQLKISQIGSRVMFLSRIDDETRENRRMAFELVQRWVRPIFEEARLYDEKDRISAALSARKRRLEAERIEEEKRKKLKPGDPEFRTGVRRPQPNRDYVIKPKSKVDVSSVSSSKKSTVMQQLNRFQRSQRRK